MLKNGPITRRARIRRASSGNRCRVAGGWARTQPMYSGTIATTQNFTPPRLTISSDRSLGETRSSFVIRICGASANAGNMPIFG